RMRGGREAWERAPRPRWMVRPQSVAGKEKPGFRRAFRTATIRGSEAEVDLREHLAADGVVGTPEERIRVEGIVLRVVVVEDVGHQEAQADVPGDVLLHRRVPDQVRRDAAGFGPVRQRAPAVAVERGGPVVLAP